MFDYLWRFLRGIHKPGSWTTACSRCGFSGHVHYTGFYPCVRYKPVATTKGRSWK